MIGSGHADNRPDDLPDTRRSITAWHVQLADKQHLISLEHDNSTSHHESTRKNFMAKMERESTLLINPYAGMMPPNPFHWPSDPDVFDETLISIKYAQECYAAPVPSVPAVPIADGRQWLPIRASVLSEGETSIVIRVTLKNKERRTLKIFSGEERGRRCFETEKSAYAVFESARKESKRELANFGRKGHHFVPKCFGWFELPAMRRQGLADDITGLKGQEHISTSDVAAGLDTLFRILKQRDWEGPLHGLVLANVRGTPITPLNVTISSANAALDALAFVHSLGIAHRDSPPDNFLLRRNGKAVIVGFSYCAVPPNRYANTIQFWREMRNLWNMFFLGMIPDRKLGIHREWFGLEYSTWYSCMGRELKKEMETNNESTNSESESGESPHTDTGGEGTRNGQPQEDVEMLDGSAEKSTMK